VIDMSDQEEMKLRNVRMSVLNGKNWNVWKFQIRHVMRANNLLGIMDGTIKKPALVTDANQIVTNQKEIDN